jgi:hypothetical protein
MRVEALAAASATSAMLICGAVEKSSVTCLKSDMALFWRAGWQPFVDIIGGWELSQRPAPKGLARAFPLMLRFIGRRLWWRSDALRSSPWPSS